MRLSVGLQQRRKRREMRLKERKKKKEKRERETKKRRAKERRREVRVAWGGRKERKNARKEPESRIYCGIPFKERKLTTLTYDV